MRSTPVVAALAPAYLEFLTPFLLSLATLESGTS